MDASDEKFFEALSGAKTEADERYEVALVKAAPPSSHALASKTKMTTPRENEKMPWHEGGPEGQLTVDVYQTPSEIVVESAIAGVKPEDLDINVTPDSISIRGSRERESITQDEDYIYQECYWGRFARSIILPQEVDPENAEVIFKNGVLRVRLPKANKQKAKKLRVKVE